MGFFRKVGEILGAVFPSSDSDSGDDHMWAENNQPINPASGLPTVGGIGSQDVAGNSWGTTDHFGSSPSFDD